MSRSDRLFLVFVSAVALASIDLIVKHVLPTAQTAYHHRSEAWVGASILLLAAAGLLSLLSSALAASAGGVMTAGILGNLVSARWNGNWVPNPFLISHGDYFVAFNLADVFFFAGNLLLMVALIVGTVRHRHQLAPPRRWERALVRRLGAN